jgi:hypothetical protein
MQASQHIARGRIIVEYISLTAFAQIYNTREELVGPTVAGCRLLAFFCSSAVWTGDLFQFVSKLLYCVLLQLQMRA